MAMNFNFEGEAEAEVPCLERLQREAFICLNGFPNKVMGLNNIIDGYTPHPASKSHPAIAHHQEHGSRSVESTREHDPDHDGVSYASVSTLERCRTRTGICKRKYYRLRCFGGQTLRRRPGPLSQILTAIANSLAVCTKAIIVRPSRYIIENILSMFLQSDFLRRSELIHVQCGPSAIWGNSMSQYASHFSDKGQTVDNFIRIMRPSAAQLIADTTVLKRWLQALALTSVPSTPALTHAARTTETIDCWAYELFFHLKYLHENRSRYAEKAAVLSFKVSDDVTHTNLWHRMVQLRDNYVILYETLYSNNQFLGQSWESTEVTGANYSSLFSA